MNDQIECNDCSWQGDSTMLVTEDDLTDDTPVKVVQFNHCPDCGSTDIEDVED